jgi:hypothetical protein
MSEDPIMPNGYTLNQITSCEHRGKQKGFKNKGTGCSCNAKHRENLYRCALHEYCTVNRYSKNQEAEGIHICVTCKNVSLSKQGE